MMLRGPADRRSLNFPLEGRKDIYEVPYKPCPHPTRAKNVQWLVLVNNNEMKNKTTDLVTNRANEKLLGSDTLGCLCNCHCLHRMSKKVWLGFHHNLWSGIRSHGCRQIVLPKYELQYIFIVLCEHLVKLMLPTPKKYAICAYIITVCTSHTALDWSYISITAISNLWARRLK